MTLLAGMMVLGATTAAQATDGKVQVCHATSSDTQPYQWIEVDENSTELQAHRAHKDEPNKKWKTDGTWNGIPHEAGDPKPDLIGDEDGVPHDRVKAKEFCETRGEGEEQEVTPVYPFADPPTCTSDGVLRVPSQPDGVVVDLAEGEEGDGPGTYDFEYSADTGYILVGDDERTVTVLPRLTGEQCAGPTLVTTAVSFADPTCPNLGGSSIVGAVDTDGIDYTVTGTPGLGRLVSVTAVPKAGFEFTAGSSTEWAHRFPTRAQLDCDVIGGVEDEDACPNIRGLQESVPAGFSLVNGRCVKDQVKGVEKEKPAEKPVIKGVEAAAPVPTAVDAGFGGPMAGSSTTATLLGQGLLGGGLTLLLLAGWMRKGRLPRGAHQV